MGLSCRLCGKRSPERSLRCDCGYEFATRDVSVAIAQARWTLSRSRRRVARGVAALAITPFAAMIPLVFGIAADSFALVGVGLLVALTGIVVGTWDAIAGTRSNVASVRRLRRARAMSVLPTARLLE